MPRIRGAWNCLDFPHSNDSIGGKLGALAILPVGLGSTPRGAVAAPTVTEPLAALGEGAALPVPGAAADFGSASGAEPGGRARPITPGGRKSGEIQGAR